MTSLLEHSEACGQQNVDFSSNRTPYTGHYQTRLVFLWRLCFFVFKEIIKICWLKWKRKRGAWLGANHKIVWMPYIIAFNSVCVLQKWGHAKHRYHQQKKMCSKQANIAQNDVYTAQFSSWVLQVRKRRMHMKNQK